MEKQKVLVFDFDGTICDSEKTIFDILNNMVPGFGLKRVNKSEYKKLRNLGSRELLKELHIPMYKVPFIVRRLRKELSGEIPNLHPIKGIPDVLKELKVREQCFRNNYIKY